MPTRVQTSKRISRARPSRIFPSAFNSCLGSIMTTSEKSRNYFMRELPQKSKNAKITVRENNGLYSTCWYNAYSANMKQYGMEFFLQRSIW